MLRKRAQYPQSHAPRSVRRRIVTRRRLFLIACILTAVVYAVLFLVSSSDSLFDAKGGGEGLVAGGGKGGDHHNGNENNHGGDGGAVQGGLLADEAGLMDDGDPFMNGIVTGELTAALPGEQTPLDDTAFSPYRDFYLFRSRDATSLAVREEGGAPAIVGGGGRNATQQLPACLVDDLTEDENVLGLPELPSDTDRDEHQHKDGTYAGRVNNTALLREMLTTATEGKDDLEQVLNVFRLYGRLYNISLDQFPARSTDGGASFEPADEKANNDEIHKESVRNDVRRMEAVNRKAMEVYAKAFIPSGAATAAAATAGEVSGPSTVVSPQAILENYYTAPADDLTRYPPGHDRHHSDREWRTLEGQQENIFGINSETESDLLDDKYALKHKNIIPRSAEFFNAFHLTRRGYGLSGSIFVALVPIFSESNAVSHHQRQQQVRGMEREEGEVSTRNDASPEEANKGEEGEEADMYDEFNGYDYNPFYLSPAQRRNTDGQVTNEFLRPGDFFFPEAIGGLEEVEAAAMADTQPSPHVFKKGYYYYDSTPTAAPNATGGSTTSREKRLAKSSSKRRVRSSLFSSFLDESLRADLLLNTPEGRSSACASTLESLYSQARWPVSIFTGVLEIAVKKEYTGDEVELLKATTKEYELAARDALAFTEASGDGKGGVAGTNSSHAKQELPPNKDNKKRSFAKLADKHPSTLHLLFSCMPENLQRHENEESYGFQFKDNIRRRLMTLPLNQNKRKPGESDEAYRTKNTYFNYDENVFPLLRVPRKLSTGERDSLKRKRPTSGQSASSMLGGPPGGETLPFSSEHGMRLALLKLYRGETYLMFLRVEEHIGGPLSAALLRQNLASDTVLLAHLRHLSETNNDNVKGVNPKLVYYESVSTLKVFKKDWDWTTRLMYLALPEKDRAVLSTRAREVDFFLPNSDLQTNLNRANSHHSSHNRRVLALEKERYISGDFPTLYAAAVAAVLQDEAEARQRVRGNGESIPGGNGLNENLFIPITGVHPDDLEEETAKQMQNAVVRLRKQINRLFPPAAAGKDSPTADNENNGKNPASNAEAMYWQRREVALRLALPSFAAQAARAGGVAAEALQALLYQHPMKRNTDNDQYGEKSDHGKQVEEKEEDGGAVLEEALNTLLFGPLVKPAGNGRNDTESKKEDAARRRPLSISLKQSDGLTEREVVELLFPLALTEAQQHRMHVLLCTSWLSAEVNSDRLTPEEAKRRAAERGEGRLHPLDEMVFLKKHYEFCFVSSRRDRLKAKMDALLFQQPGKRDGTTESSDPSVALSPRFVLSNGQKLALNSLSATAGRTVAADEKTEGAQEGLLATDLVPLLVPQIAAAPSVNGEGPYQKGEKVNADADPRKGSLRSRLLRAFYPSTSGGTSETSAFFPFFKLTEKLVPRVSDALNDMRFFSVPSLTNTQAKEGETATAAKNPPFPMGSASGHSRREALTQTQHLRQNRMTETDGMKEEDAAPFFLTNAVSADFLFTRADAFFNYSRALQSIFSEEELLATTEQGSSTAAATGGKADLIDVITRSLSLSRSDIANGALQKAVFIAQKRKQQQERHRQLRNDTDRIKNRNNNDSETTRLGKAFNEACGYKHSQTLLDVLEAETGIFSSADLSPSSVSLLAHFLHEPGQHLASRFTFLRQQPEAVLEDTFLFFTTKEEEDLLLSALLWTAGWNFFAPTENVLLTVRFISPAELTVPASLLKSVDDNHDETKSPQQVDEVSLERLSMLRNATVRRLRQVFHLPTKPIKNADGKEGSFSSDSSLYYMGCQRSLQAYWQFTGLSPAFDTS